MLRKTTLIIMFTAITTLTFAQSQHITSAAIIFKQYNSEKDKSVKAVKIQEAKEFIDKAYVNASTSNEPKMWMYRAKIYKMIAINHSSLDIDAIFKATESHLKCMQPHPKKKDKIMIFRKWPKEDVLESLVQCGYKLFNQAIEEYNSENYKRSLKYYTAIFDIIPFDEQEQLKRGNITKETILYNSFFSSNKMKDNIKSKELLQQLIDINFNEPVIYIHMSNIFLEEEKTDKALEYLSLGREMFEDDQSLLNAEINLYIKLGRTSELIEKLGEAIALDEENNLLYFNRGTIYDQQGDFTNAEKDYKYSLDIDPNVFSANYNLGALYFNAATKEKYGSKSANRLFDEAFPYLEKAYLIDPKDRNTLLSLKQLYYIKGNEAKEKEMKKLIAELKK